MNDQLTEKPGKTRRLTDIALVLIAISAIATWLWRRTTDSATPTNLPPHDEAQPIDGEMSSGVGSSPANNS